MIDSPNIVTDPGSVLLFPFLTSSQRPIRVLISGSIFIYKIIYFLCFKRILSHQRIVYDALDS